MTRIIAGTAGGRRIAVPVGDGTRPTADRAREGLFSTLASLIDLEGARVLDLFSGSGALGLEAVSRGAGAALLVERDPKALAVLTDNVRTLALDGVEVLADDAVALAARPAPAGEAYDVLLADPPYVVEAESVTALVADLLAHGWLAEGAVLAVERPTRRGEFAWPDGVEAVRSRRYGEATLWYGRRP